METWSFESHRLVSWWRLRSEVIKTTLTLWDTLGIENHKSHSRCNSRPTENCILVLPFRTRNSCP